MTTQIQKILAEFSPQELRQIVNLVSAKGLTPDGQRTQYTELMMKLNRIERNLSDDSEGIMIIEK